MTEKRFCVNELVKYNYSEIGEYIDENHTDRPLRNDEVCELLNELHEENQELKQEMGILGTAHAEEINKIEDKFDEEILKLEKENEELKQRNKKRLQRLKNQRKELEKQQEAIWGYKGDIKQLKAQLKDCEKRVSDKEVEWLRENTVWEQMPSNRKTFISTIYHRRNDE